MTIYVSKETGDEFALRVVFADFVHRTVRGPNREEIMRYGLKLTAEQMRLRAARKESKKLTDEWHREQTARRRERQIETSSN